MMRAFLLTVALLWSVIASAQAPSGGPLLMQNSLSEIAARGTQSVARTNLGLGSLATQSAGAAAITGGTISGLSSLGVVGNATIGGTLGVTGAATFNGGMAGTLTGHATLDLPLAGGTITGNLAIGGTLSAGATTLSSLAVTGNATVGGTTTLTGLLTANGGAAINGGETVTGGFSATSANGSNSIVVGNGGTTITGNETVTGSQTVTGNHNVTGNETVTGTTTLTGLLTANGGTTVNGLLTANNGLAVSGGATITAGGLGVTGGTTTDTLNVTGTLSSTGATSLATGGGLTTVGGNATIGGTLAVTGALSAAATTITGAATVSTTLGVTGTSTLAGVTATSIGDTGTLAVTGATSLATGGGATTTGGSLGVATNATVGGTLGVTGATSLSNATTTGTLGVGTNATVGGTLGVTGNTTLSNATIGGTLGVTGAATLGGGLTVNGAVPSVSISDVVGSHAINLHVYDANVWSGAIQPSILGQVNMSGTAPTGNYFANQLTITDSVNSTSTGYINGLAVNYTMTGGAGGRVALGSTLNITGPITAATGVFEVAFASTASASASAGGISGGSQGNLFGSNPLVYLQSGAGLYWFSLVGQEIDVNQDAGTGVNYRIGQQIVLDTANNHGTQLADAALSITGGGTGVTTNGWNYGIAFGYPFGGWSFTGGATLIGSVASSLGETTYAAAYGLDFSAIAFSAAFLKGPNGALWDGSANLTAASLKGTTSSLNVFGSYGYGAIIYSGAASNSYLLVDTTAANQVSLAPSSGTNTWLRLYAVGSGVVDIASPLKAEGTVTFTGLPITCSGHPTNSVAAVAGVLTLCP